MDLEVRIIPDDRAISRKRVGRKKHVIHDCSYKTGYVGIQQHFLFDIRSAKWNLDSRKYFPDRSGVRTSRLLVGKSEVALDTHEAAFFFCTKTNSFPFLSI